MTYVSRNLSFVAVLGTLSLLAACGANPSSSSSGAAPAKETSAISSTVQKAIAEARQEIAEGNISVQNGKNGQRVELSPKGDLLIDGKAVPVTPEQRALVLDYRGHVQKVANAGVDIGLQGADLATRAVTESITGIFTGRTDDIEKRVEAEADKIRASALQLCALLPAMRDSQNRLADSLPEFRPYANLDQSDIDDCAKEAKEKGHQATMNAAAEAAAGAEAAKAPIKQ